MSSEIDALNEHILDEDTITHLRTDDGSLRYPISVTDAIFMDSNEQMNLTQYLKEMGTSTLYAKQLLAVQFTKDSDGFYTYEFQNPFDTNKVICNMRNTAGENLVCACTITGLTVQVTLTEPEDCWVLLSGDNIGNIVVDGGSDASSHSHTNRAILDRLGNLDGRLTYGGNMLAYESLIGDLSKINGNNIVDILLKMCEMLNLDLGEPDAPEIPKSDPVLNSTTSSNLTNRLNTEVIIIRYSFVSDTTTNTLYVIIDDVENTQAITDTSGSVSVGPFEPGSHTVTLMIEDTNGNLSNPLTFNISVIEKAEEEPTVPNPELSSSSSKILSFNEGETVTIEYSYTSVTDDNTLYYGINKGSLMEITMSEKEGSGTLQIGPFEPGQYMFSMYIKDGNGNTSKEVAISLNVAEVAIEEPAGIESIIINQFYSAGGKDDGALTHDFIELYNTSNSEVNIHDLNIFYAGGTNSTLHSRWYKFALSSSNKVVDGKLMLPGHTSFLIIMKNQVTPASADFDLTNVTHYGKTYNLEEIADMTYVRPTISNKYAKVVLSSSPDAPPTANPLIDENVLDCMIAANTDSTNLIEPDLYDNCIQGLSKSWGVRRVNFAKTGLSVIEDMEVIYYKTPANAIFLPRAMEVGPWTELGIIEGDDMFETNGIAVTKLFFSEDQLALLQSNQKAIGEAWHYTAANGIRSIKAYIEAKYQNYSGEPGNKESIKIDLYSDENLYTELDMKFGKETFSKCNWPKLDKFVLRSTRKDPSHAHNIVTGEIIRQSYKENHINPDKDAEVFGIVDGFPTVVYINDEKQGIYTFNETQSRKIYGIGKDDLSCAIFKGTSNSGAVSDTVKFKTLCNFTDKDHYEWEDRYPEAYEDEALQLTGEANKSNLNALISYVMNTEEDSFYESLHEHMDIDYLIDYFLWCYFGGFTDSTANNLILLSYDGKIYIPTFYDMDASFGLDHKGNTMLPTDIDLFTDYRVSDSLLWDKLFGSSADPDIFARYKELRETTMNKEFILSQFDRFWDMIPEEEQAFDAQKWPSQLLGESGSFATHRQQLEEWLTAREIWCDNQLGNN